MFFINSDNYVHSYWMNNDVVDCCKLENIQNENLSQNDITDIYEDTFKKLNNNININNIIESNNGEESHISINSRINQTNRGTANRTNKNTKRHSGSEVRIMRNYSGEETYKHNIIQETINSNNIKRKVYKLPEKCRIQEYRNQRNILFDPFTKPRIISVQKN